MRSFLPLFCWIKVLLDRVAPIQSATHGHWSLYFECRCCGNAHLDWSRMNKICSEGDIEEDGSPCFQISTGTIIAPIVWKNEKIWERKYSTWGGLSLPCDIYNLGYFYKSSLSTYPPHDPASQKKDSQAPCKVRPTSYTLRPVTTFRILHKPSEVFAMPIQNLGRPSEVSLLRPRISKLPTQSKETRSTFCATDFSNVSHSKWLIHYLRHLTTYLRHLEFDTGRS